jgi:hypothetical protein
MVGQKKRGGLKGPYLHDFPLSLVQGITQVLNWWLSHVVTAEIFLRAPHVLNATRKPAITPQGQFRFGRNTKWLELECAPSVALGQEPSEWSRYQCLAVWHTSVARTGDVVFSKMSSVVQLTQKSPHICDHANLYSIARNMLDEMYQGKFLMKFRNQLPQSARH